MHATPTTPMSNQKPFFHPDYSLTLRTGASGRSPPAISPRQRIRPRPPPRSAGRPYCAIPPTAGPSYGNLHHSRLDAHCATNQNQTYNHWEGPSQTAPVPQPFYHHYQAYYSGDYQFPARAQGPPFAVYSGHPQNTNVHQFRPPFPQSSRPAYQNNVSSRSPRFAQMYPPTPAPCQGSRRRAPQDPRIVIFNVSDTETSDCFSESSTSSRTHPPRRQSQLREKGKWPTATGSLVFDVSDAENDGGDGYESDESDDDENMRMGVTIVAEAEEGRVDVDSVSADPTPHPSAVPKKRIWPTFAPVTVFDISDTEDDDDASLSCPSSDELDTRQRKSSLVHTFSIPPPTNRACVIRRPPPPPTSHRRPEHFLEAPAVFIPHHRVRRGPAPIPSTPSMHIDIDSHIQRVTEQSPTRPIVSIPTPYSSWSKNYHTAHTSLPTSSNTSRSSTPVPKSFISPDRQTRPAHPSPSPPPADGRLRVQLPIITPPTAAPTAVATITKTTKKKSRPFYSRTRRLPAKALTETSSPIEKNTRVAGGREREGARSKGEENQKTKSKRKQKEQKRLARTDTSAMGEV